MLATKVWPAAHLPAEIVDKYREVPEDSAGGYSLDQHSHLVGATLELFEQFRKRVMNFDSSVREHIRKLYIAYKSDTNFVDVVPQKRGLRLSLNLLPEELDDPQGMAKDVSGLGHWGNGDVEVLLSSESELDYVLGLVHQAYTKQTEGIVE